MNQSFRYVTILIVLIILMPVVFFSAYEIVRIDKNEKELQTIYNKQLDAILFSLNLYSDDIINSWAGKIKNSQQNVGSQSADLEKLLSETPQIKLLAISTDSSFKSFDILKNDEKEGNASIQLSSVCTDSSRKIERLKNFYKNGYQRIEQMGSRKNGNELLIAFLLETGNHLNICFLEIDPTLFINLLLGPRIQSIAENKLDIAIYSKETKQLIYSFGLLKRESEMQHRKDIWLFPQFEMGIRLKDKSITTLTKEAQRTNLIFIILADLIFAIAAFMVFRNIRKELKLTQIKSEFISNVSHEIRTPLALISMYAETLELDRIKKEEKKKEYYQVIFNESQRLTGIVNRILNFSKIESRKKTYNLQKANLNDVISKVMQSYNFHLKNKGFDYILHLEEKLPETFIDQDAIADVLVNLLDNAIKYSADIKYIDVKTGERQNWVYAEICDKGIGISKDDQKYVFDKFFRVSKGNLANEARGTGLGLSIVKNIMSAHYGKIELESKKGEGSTFRILFPKKI